eukprot:CAMPEP_0182601048 /NCGR_PEP_ID=MMETSP1324-20130603/91289_1 /TAXON_ID=236786 /ORGANISM="Florenciella sp., Strain RCC1587" /LENGTH=832 /DNA_ID=CAMNT_0024818957 /DNA_START=193 /DNA_END=2691 /DNA_ORIENTATION=+
MAAQASPSEGPTSDSVGASTVAVQPDGAPEPSLEPPAAASTCTSTTPDPLVRVLVKDLIRTTMATIRLGKDQRRNAVRKWYAESGLDAVNAPAETTPAERSALVKAVVVELDLIRTTMANILLGKDQRRNAVRKWYAESGLDAVNAPAERYALVKAVVVELAMKLRFPLKLSRFRLVAKVLVILAVSQVDLVTDLLMLVEYSRQADREGALVASACIMGLGWLVHVGIAFWSNTGCSASAVAREVLIAATFLAPVVGTYRFAVGAELDENRTAILTPLWMYLLVKLIELVFESIPESILQASVLLQSEAGDRAMSSLSIVSFAASLLAAGLLVADLNYTMENDRMKGQQTPGVHPFYGFLRTSARGQAALFLSSWAFLSSYLACTVFAFGCLLVTQPWWVFVGLAAAEVLAFGAFKAAQGEFTASMNHSNDLVVDWVGLIAYYILTSSVPIFQLRYPSEIGPRAFSGLIGYRLVANTAIVYLTATSFDILDKAVTTEQALFMYGIAFGVAVVSLAATLCSMEPAYRHTFVGSKTGKQYWREFWLTDVLHDSNESMDKQREGIMSILHPLYTPLDLAVPWILEKAAEVEQAQSNAESSEATFVVPRWLSKHHCDRQMANIKFWEDTGGLSEAEAQQLRGAVETLRGAIRDDVPPSSASSPSSPSSPGSASLSAPPAQAASVSAPPAQAAERNPNQLPSLKGAKVAPLSVDSEGEPEQNPGQPLPPIGTAVAAPPAGRQARGRALSRAEILGVPAAAINPRRSTAAAGAGLTPMVLALELAGVLRESTRTKEAVEEWWDVNMALLAADSDRALLVALMEELQPALLLAMVFVRV